LADSSSASHDHDQNEEVITTASPSAPSENGGRTDGPATSGTGSSVVREWVNELTGRTERENAGIRVPSEAEIAQLISMFPDLQRQVVIGALQRRYVVPFPNRPPNLLDDNWLLIAVLVQILKEQLKRF
jgi:hypothetical protein